MVPQGSVWEPTYGLIRQHKKLAGLCYSPLNDSENRCRWIIVKILHFYGTFRSEVAKADLLQRPCGQICGNGLHIYLSVKGRLVLPFQRLRHSALQLSRFRYSALDQLVVDLDIGSRSQNASQQYFFRNPLRPTPWNAMYYSSHRHLSAA